MAQALPQEESLRAERAPAIEPYPAVGGGNGSAGALAGVEECAGWAESWVDGVAQALGIEFVAGLALLASELLVELPDVAVDVQAGPVLFVESGSTEKAV